MAKCRRTGFATSRIHEGEYNGKEPAGESPCLRRSRRARARLVSQRIRLLFKSSAGLVVLIGFLAFLVSLFATAFLYTERIRLTRQADEARNTLVSLLYSSNEKTDAVSDALNSARLATTNLPTSDERQRLDAAITQAFSAVRDLKSNLVTIARLLAQRGFSLAEAQLPAPHWANWTFGVVGPVFGQAQTTTTYESDVKLYILLCLIALLGCWFMASIFIILTSTNTRVVSFAMDSLKSLVGFFIGIVSGILGIPLRR